VPDPCSVRVDAPRELARPEAAKQLAGGESARAGASLDARSGHNKRRPRGCARYMTASDCPHAAPRASAACWLGERAGAVAGDGCAGRAAV
jgi:hypothetical protein